MNYFNIIKIAILVFSIISILLTLPFLLYHYRKYGSISFIKYFVKWLLLHLFILNGFILIMIFNNRFFHVSIYVYIWYFALLFIFFVYCFICLILKEDIFINRMLGITSVSTICLDDE